MDSQGWPLGHNKISRESKDNIMSLAFIILIKSICLYNLQNLSSMPKDVAGTAFI